MNDHSRKVKEWHRKHEIVDSIPYLARAEAHYALKNNDIIKPKLCQRCYKDKHLIMHHPDYDKPLDIIWLCYLCHRQTF